MSKFEDLTGRKFNRLTVIKRAENNRFGQTQWLCECICGNKCVIYGYDIKCGKTRSCGCLQKEQASYSNTTHGLSNTSLYNIWLNMKGRCCNLKNKRYQDYGGRGIEVCQHWRNSYEAFEEDVSKLPHYGEKGYTLDRIDNNGSYEPGNVRWATAKEQQNNTRRNHYLTYKGKTQTIAQWAEELGINRYTLYNRILTYNWSIEKALITP